MTGLQNACRKALCGLIRVYQYTLSPWIGRSCRFTPSCSNYTMQAIMTHGCIKGILLGTWRIARCNPLGKWGYDPVPEPGRWQNPARRLQPAKLFSTRHRKRWKNRGFFVFRQFKVAARRNVRATACFMLTRMLPQGASVSICRLPLRPFP